MLLLDKSLKTLSAKSQAEKLRLWGKVRGTEKDYYIVEAVVAATEAEEGGGEEGGQAPIEGMEPRGTGLNKYVYFANNNPHTNDWT